MGKFIYTAFLALFSVKELSTIFGFKMNLFLDLVCLFFFGYILIGYIFGILAKWIWVRGIEIVVFFYLFFTVISLFISDHRMLSEIDSYIDLFIWCKSVDYLNKNQ